MEAVEIRRNGIRAETENSNFEQIAELSQLLRDVAATGERGEQMVGKFVSYWTSTIELNMGQSEIELVQAMRAARKRHKQAAQMMAG